MAAYTFPVKPAPGREPIIDLAIKVAAAQAMAQQIWIALVKVDKEQMHVYMPTLRDAEAAQTALAKLGDDVAGMVGKWAEQHRNDDLWEYKA